MTYILNSGTPEPDGTGGRIVIILGIVFMVLVILEGIFG